MIAPIGLYDSIRFDRITIIDVRAYLIMLELKKICFLMFVNTKKHIAINFDALKKISIETISK